jgi:hypothetical protein
LFGISGGTERKHEVVSQDSRSPGRTLIVEPAEYEAVLFSYGVTKGLYSVSESVSQSLCLCRFKQSAAGMQVKHFDPVSS